ATRVLSGRAAQAERAGALSNGERSIESGRGFKSRDAAEMAKEQPGRLSVACCRLRSGVNTVVAPRFWPVVAFGAGVSACVFWSHVLDPVWEARCPSAASAMWLRQTPVAALLPAGLFAFLFVP